MAGAASRLSRASRVASATPLMPPPALNNISRREIVRGAGMVSSVTGYK
jgi:hypothetical protein